MSDKPDERLTWALASPDREILQRILPTPEGWSITTQYLEKGEVKRQDCEVAIRRGTASSGKATGFLRRLLGG